MTEPEVARVGPTYSRGGGHDESRATVSVIVAAHNEEATIARCLDALLEDAQLDEFEVIVACNGCSDATAELAIMSCPDAKVLELPVASKIAALNAGDEVATRFPRFYLDADVETPTAAIRAAADELISGRYLCVAAVPSFELVGRPWVVRKFYEVWQQLPYLRSEVVGNGMYGMSAEGRARFGVFPEIIADDQFVLQTFALSERHTLRHVSVTVHPPKNVADLVRIRARAYRGSRELAKTRARDLPARARGGPSAPEAPAEARERPGCRRVRERRAVREGEGDPRATRMGA